MVFQKLMTFADFLEYFLITTWAGSGDRVPGAEPNSYSAVIMVGGRPSVRFGNMHQGLDINLP